MFTMVDPRGRGLRIYEISDDAYLFKQMRFVFDFWKMGKYIVHQI